MISEIDIEDMGPPQIHLVRMEEHEDGSATCEVKTNQAGTHLLVQWGLIAMLEKAIKNEVRTND